MDRIQRIGDVIFNALPDRGDHRPDGVQNTGDEAGDRIPYGRDHIGNGIHYRADSGRDRIPDRLKKCPDSFQNERYNCFNGLPCGRDLFVNPVHNTGDNHMDRIKNRLKQILESVQQRRNKVVNSKLVEECFNIINIILNKSDIELIGPDEIIKTTILQLYLKANLQLISNDNFEGIHQAYMRTKQVETIATNIIDKTFIKEELKAYKIYFKK